MRTLWFACLLFGLTMQGQQISSTAAPGNPESPQLFAPQSASAAAREALQRGVVLWENHRMAQAADSFRKAAQADPNLAVAHLLLSTLTADPDEQSSELKKAIALRDAATPDEQLLIDWQASTSQNQILPAIVAMNELMGHYPKDEHLLYREAIWFRNQRQLDRAVPVYERILQLDPKFADALNQLGYIHAFQGEFDPAIASMKRYVVVLPDEPNPEDSYGEICRMAGRYDEALAHYRRALKIDPSYWSSQEGIAGTYSLMGDQARARAEYAIAIEHAPSQATGLLWTMNSAVTWVREKEFAKASAVYRDVARRAHDANLAEAESTAFRMMSLYEKDTGARQELLDRAEAALDHDHTVSALVREQQTALVQRERIYADLDVGNVKSAQQVLEQLRTASEMTHNGFVKVVWHGAAGAVLAMQGKYEDAIGELQQDDRNPFSLKFLVLAYQKSGSKGEAARWGTRLSSVKNPTLELLVATSPLFHQAAASPVATSQK